MYKFPNGTNTLKVKLISPLDSLITNAPLKLIQKLPRSTSKQLCSICISPLEQSPSLLLFCIHSFHTNCLKKMIIKNGLGQEQLSCPLCKTNMIECWKAQKLLMK